MVGGEDVAFDGHVKDLQESAGHSAPLSGNGNSSPAPHYDGWEDVPSLFRRYVESGAVSRMSYDEYREQYASEVSS